MASSPVPRSHSRASFYSTTTYHSFQDIELYEPGSQSETSGFSSAKDSASKEAPVRRPRPPRSEDMDRPSSFQMIRQDSGYESSTPHHTSNYTKRQRDSSKRTSTSPQRTDRARQRPSLRRSGPSKSVGPVSHIPARTSLTLTRPTSLSQQQQQNLTRKHSYFQFPSPDNLVGQELDSLSSARPSADLAPVILKVNTANANTNGPEHPPDSPPDDRHYHNSPASPIATPPPQTTHYWTSDRTRRLEYAAIDAASRGVRGWVMRNIVPECLVSRDNRRNGFDDDGGSVRRYRLDLEIECPEDAVPPSPVGEKPRGFRARGSKASWWARLRGGP